MKKRIIILFALVLITPHIQAQEKQETLFGENLNISKIGIMVEPGIQVTQLSREAAGFFQFRGGLIFNDKITFGGFYGQLLTDVRPETFANSLPDRAHLDSWTAGGFLEYTVFSNKLFHFTFPLSAGVMEVEIDNEGRGFDYDESQTLFVEPRALLEVNLHRFARLNAGIGYRVMGSVIQNAMDVPTAGNSFTFQVGLKMGIFSFNQLKNN